MDHSINFNITGYWFESNRPGFAAAIDFLDENWTLSIWAAIAYVILIFGGRKIMASHERYNLSNTLAAWSGLLAVFSVLGTIRMLPNLYYSVFYQSFHESVCSIDWTHIPVLALWTSLFSISKIVELGDTVFIVLRKQPLILLHWYHHITVLVYTWYSYADRTSSGRWYITMNYAVHSVMYAYYALRALKYRPPQWVRMGITLFQLSQMVVGVYIAVYVYKLKQKATPCGVSDNNMKLSFLMYFSYFLLFAKFFYDAYISKPKQPVKSTSNGTSKNGKSHQNGHANGHPSGTMLNGQVNGETKKHS